MSLSPLEAGHKDRFEMLPSIPSCFLMLFGGGDCCLYILTILLVQLLMSSQSGVCGPTSQGIREPNVGGPRAECRGSAIVQSNIRGPWTFQVKNRE